MSQDDTRDLSVFKKKNLLIIASAYPDEGDKLIRSKFVKNQVNVLKNYFQNVYVVAPISIHHQFTEVGKISHDYVYDNVHVFFPKSVYVPLSYLSKPVVDFRLYAVRSVIRKHNLKFDLIHAHMSEPSGYISMMLKKEYNVPYVLTIHENGIWFEKEITMNHPKVIDSWRAADAIIRVNPFDIPKLREYNENSFYIANGYSPSFYPRDMFSCREKLSLPQDKRILFGLGILTERKGFQYLVEAMSHIAKDKSDVLCYIGGSGPYREHLEMMIHEFHLEDEVFLLGRVSDEDLPVWMNACDLFVLPSLNESFGVVNIEALACGKPVVATNVGGIPEIICTKDYGLLCEPGNIDDLTEKLCDAIRKVESKVWDKDKIQEYSGKYHLENICRDICDIYSEYII